MLSKQKAAPWRPTDEREETVKIQVFAAATSGKLIRLDFV